MKILQADNGTNVSSDNALKAKTKFLIIDADVEKSPFDRIPEGTLLSRLYALQIHDGPPVVCVFSQREVATLIALPKDELSDVIIIRTPTLKETPGHNVLTENYLFITESQATQIAEDYRQAKMQTHQTAKGKLAALVEQMETQEKEAYSEEPPVEGEK